MGIHVVYILEFNHSWSASVEWNRSMLFRDAVYLEPLIRGCLSPVMSIRDNACKIPLKRVSSAKP